MQELSIFDKLAMALAYRTNDLDSYLKSHDYPLDSQEGKSRYFICGTFSDIYDMLSNDDIVAILDSAPIELK